MKKWKKVLLIVFIVLTAVIIGGLVALKIAFPPEKIKTILTAKASEFLHREIEIKTVSVGLGGLEVEGFRVSEKPAFKNGTFIETNQFVIRPDLFALLKRKISISRIILVSPKINIVRNKDNSFNFSDLMSASPPVPKKEAEKKQEAKKESGTEALPIAFVVSRFEITNGDVKFTDKSSQDMSAELKNINVSLEGISLTSPFLVDMSLNIMQNKIKAPVSLAFNGVVNLNQQNLKIKKAIIKTDGAAIKISGTADKFMDPKELTFAVNIKSENILLERISKPFPLPKELSLSGEPSMDIDVSGGMDRIQVKGNVDAKKSEVFFGDMFSKPKNTDMSLTADIIFENMDSLKISNLSASIGNIKAGMSGKITGISNNKLAMDLKILLEKFDLKAVSQIVPMVKDSGISGVVEGETKISGVLNQTMVSGKVSVRDVQSLQKDMTVKVSGGVLDFSVAVAESKKTAIAFNLNGDAIDIKMPVQNPKDQKQTNVPGAESQRQTQPAQSVSVPEKTPAVSSGQTVSQPGTKTQAGVPKDIVLTGDIKLKTFVFQNYKISDCAAKIELADAVLNIKPFSMVMCKGTIAGSIRADLSDSDPSRLKFNFAADVKNYDVHELLASTGKEFKAQVWGAADGKVKISGSGSDMSKLNGNGSLTIKNMKINNFKILDKLAVVAMIPQLKETSFKSVSGTFNITNGKIDLADTKTDGGDKMDAYLSGDANLVSKTQDIKGDIKFTREYSGGDLAKYTADSEGRVTVPFTVVGSFDDPKVAINYSKIAKTAATKALLEEGGKALLKGLFGK